MDKLSEFCQILVKCKLMLNCKDLYLFLFLKVPLFVRILLSYFFIVYFYFLLSSKTKNRQHILLFAVEWRKKMERRNTRKFEEFTRLHGIIRWWLCANDFLVFSIFSSRVISGLLLLLAPEVRGFWQYSRENSLIDHDKQTLFFFTKSKGLFMWSISLGTLDECLFLFIIA